jgi:hypothetical protein
MTAPFDYSELVEQNDEVLRQEITTYLKRDGKIIKVVVERDFYDKDDYNDSMTSFVIFSGEH